MLAIIDSENLPEKYSSYKNRTVQKHLDKTTNQMWAIKSCSLTKEDKEKLKKKILQSIESFNL